MAGTHARSAPSPTAIAGGSPVRPRIRHPTVQIATVGLVRRFPTLRLAVPGADPHWRTGEQFNELTALPVRW